MAKPKIPTFERIEVDADSVLLPLTAEDVPEMYRAIADNAHSLRRFMPDWAVSTEEDVLGYYQDEVEPLTEKGKGAAYKTVHEGSFAGNAVLEYNKKLGMPELLCWLTETIQGRGIGKRVVASLRDRYFEAGISEIGLLISPLNYPSQGVARSTGAELERRVLRPIYHLLPIPVATRLLPDELWVIRNGQEGIERG